jgi:signal transduction histidine kinase
MSNTVLPRKDTSFLSFRNKLTASVVVSIITYLLIGYIAINSDNIIGSEFSEVVDVVAPAISALEDVRFAGIRIISSASEVALLDSLGVEEDGDGSEISEMDENIILYNTAFDSYRSYSQIIETHFSDRLHPVSQIDEMGQAVISGSSRLIELVETGASDEEIIAARKALKEVEETFLSILAESIMFEQEEYDVGHDFVTATINSTLSLSLISVAAAGILVAVIGFYIYLSAAKPMREFEKMAIAIQQGDFSVRIVLEVQDEFGQLAETFNTMAAAVEHHNNEQIAKLEQQLVEVENARVQAEQADQVKSAFLASMSHELRTPLNSVINFTKFVVRGVMGPVTEKQIDTLNKVISSGQHLLALINDILDMSKIESGSLNLFIEDDLDPNAILKAVINNAEALLAEKNIRLEQDIQADLPKMRADRKRITQILLNMVSNACKFTEKGFVKIKARAEDDNLLISVQDTGPGIASEDSESVFLSFKQTKTGLRQGEGTGLGMPISKSLAEAHGGQLWFESEVGQGTTFYIKLPLQSEALEITT